MRKLWLLLALCLPIAALAWQTWQHQQRYNEGKDITLPIRGFDPRDLLSGHYLIYEVDYGVENICELSNTAQLCMTKKPYLIKEHEETKSCSLVLKGKCDQGNFKAGIERFYIPEAHAQTLDQALRDQKGSITIAIDPQGKAQVKELWIEKQQWQTWLKQQPAQE